MRVNAGSAQVAVVAVLLFLSVLAGGARAQGPPDCAKEFAFAEALLAEADYFRAIGEYKRVVFVCPAGPQAQQSLFRIGESYYAAKRWKEALDALDAYLAQYPSGTFSPRARYLKGMAEKEIKRFGDAKKSFETLMQDNAGGLADRAAFQKALVLIEEDQWNEAAEVLGLVAPVSPIRPNAERLSRGLADLAALPQKSPGTAGVLAAILPGAGHLYTERPADAGVAFLLNATFIAAAVELFRKDENILGAIVTFVEAGWYLGNIYSAVGSAHKYNKRQRERFLERLLDETAISLRCDPLTGTSHIALGFRF